MLCWNEVWAKIIKTNKSCDLDVAFDVWPTSKTVGGSTSRVYRGWHCIQRWENYYDTQCDTQWLTLMRGTRTCSVI